MTRPPNAPAVSGTALRVVPVGDRMDEWERHVARDASATFCHRGGWRTIMSDVLGHECIYLAAVDEAGTWRGVLPLVRVRGLLGHFLVSMPFVNDGGPLGDEAARTRLTEHAVEEARRSGAGLLELRGRERIAGPVAIGERKVAVHLPLPETTDALWATTFKAKLRSQIRRPGKEGMTARVGPGELEAFHRVFARNMRDLGTPVLPRAFFERLASTFGNDVVFATVYTAKGEPAAAGCSLVWRHEMEITWASSVREHNRFSPNMLLYARLMEAAVARGVRVFNFGRSTPGAATHRFKQQWGGADVPLPWATWSSSGTNATPSPDRAAFRLATAVWSRLPLALTNRVGPLLARQIP